MVASSRYLTVDNYLCKEEQSAVKHEYRDGYAYAMAGASDTHVTIAGNLFALLRNHVRTTSCRVYISDMKVRIDSINCFYYPDILVTCDDRDRQTSNHKKYPKLIIEVLSNSTETFDRGDKFADYQQISNLEEYFLINPKRQRIECFRKTSENLWALHTFTSDRQIYRFESIGFSNAIVDVYEDISFD